MSLQCAAKVSLEATNLLGEIRDLTVGQKFILKCGGSFNALKQDAIKLLAPVSEGGSVDVPALSLIQVLSLNEGDVELLVTSYRVGTHSLDGFSLTDDSQVLKMTGIEWEVKSVIQEQQKPEPYPSYPFWEMSYPLWFYGVFVFVLCALIAIPTYIFKRLKRRKIAFDKVKEYDTVLIPLDAFYKELRRIEKLWLSEKTTEKEFVSELAKQFRLFLTREFKVPAFEWPISEVLKEIKKSHYRFYKIFSARILKFFKETEASSISKKDILYFTEEAQKLVEDIDNEIQKKRGKK